jgi:hypothetical protein
MEICWSDELREVGQKCRATHVGEVESWRREGNLQWRERKEEGEGNLQLVEKVRDLLDPSHFYCLPRWKKLAIFLPVYLPTIAYHPQVYPAKFLKGPRHPYEIRFHSNRIHTFNRLHMGSLQIKRAQKK